MKLVNILLVLLLGVCLENDVVTGLKFAIRDSIKVDNPNGVIQVGEQTKLTCNYLTNSRETVNKIIWYVSYEASNTNYGNVFTYHVNTGQKVNYAAELSHLTVFENSATPKDVEIKINGFRESPITIKCEVEVHKDNGYGRTSSHKKAAEKSFDVVEVEITPTVPVLRRPVPRTRGEHDLHEDVHQLLNMIDPRRHTHFGVPYDFYSGYILMVAKVPDIGSNFGSRRINQQSTQSVQLYGQLPNGVIRELQTTQRRFQEISDKKYKLEMDPVDMLNLLGNHGFRAIGSTSTADQKIIWTLEQRDFENLLQL